MKHSNVQDDPLPGLETSASNLHLFLLETSPTSSVMLTNDRCRWQCRNRPFKASSVHILTQVPRKEPQENSAHGQSFYRQRDTLMEASLSRRIGVILQSGTTITFKKPRTANHASHTAICIISGRTTQVKKRPCKSISSNE